MYFSVIVCFYILKSVYLNLIKLYCTLRRDMKS
nr:MAG TPA: hypothetical protein [Caudoviricetes sp.]